MDITDNRNKNGHVPTSLAKAEKEEPGPPVIHRRTVWISLGLDKIVELQIL